MNIVCLDLEGVLVPEIWIAFAEESGIPELKRTTRDEPDYDKLMKYRQASLCHEGRILHSVEEHRDIFRAMEIHDIAKVEGLMLTHIEHAFDSIMKGDEA